MCSVDQAAEFFGKLFPDDHLVNIDRYPYKLNSFLNFILQKQRDWRSVLPTITNEECEWLHLGLLLVAVGQFEVQKLQVQMFNECKGLPRPEESATRSTD